MSKRFVAALAVACLAWSAEPLVFAAHGDAHSELTRTLTLELSTLESERAQDEARSRLATSQRAMSRSESTAAYRGHQAARRLDAYQIAATTRDEQVRERARVLYKLARGGVSRLVFEDRHRSLYPIDITSTERRESQAAERVRAARGLHRLVAHELEELAVYRRAEEEARRELLTTSRELSVHTALRSYASFQRTLLDSLDAKIDASLAKQEQQRRKALRSESLDRNDRALLRQISRARTQARRAEAVDDEVERVVVLRPVPGDVVGSFGTFSDPVLGVPMLRNGIELSARAREKVRAPLAGRVVFVGTRPDFDHVVVLDHGNDMRSMIGRLIDVTVQPDEELERGAVIGRPAPARAGEDQGRTIYFELRRGEQPLDPQPGLRSY